jgi:hypothetical protein
MNFLITLVILFIIIKVFLSVRNFFLKKSGFHGTVTKYGPQVPLAFNIDEAEFLYEYVHKSMEIAEHNGKEANANMLREINRKLIKATLDETLVRHNAENGNHREFERNGEFS